MSDKFCESYAEIMAKINRYCSQKRYKMAISIAQRELKDSKYCSTIIDQIQKKIDQSIALTWLDLEKRKSIKLYAGTLPELEQYNGYIGLALDYEDNRHINHNMIDMIPLADNSVDVFQSEDVFEHIEYDKLVPIINEIYRVLKPGALFRLSLPDYGCDVLDKRCIKDQEGNIVDDPGGKCSADDPGHLWFPRYGNVKKILEQTDFADKGEIEYLHFYRADGSFELEDIDYSLGYVKRTPDNDERVANPRRPMSLVVDLYKEKKQSKVVGHYNEEYFSWQKNVGAFGGIANKFKFEEYIDSDHTVVDFGCGGGFLLHNLECKEKIGIEINPRARANAQEQGLKVFENLSGLEDNSVDRIISNHALEHVENPLSIIRQVYKKLKPDAKAIFVVPHQDCREAFNPKDRNKHLYTWNQMTLGNLFLAAGFEIEKSEAIQHQWPADYIKIFSDLGEEKFHARCREFALQNNNYQIRVVGVKRA